MLRVVGLAEEATKEGVKVSERTINTSGQIVLECSGCGERVILLGHEDDWSREHRNAFECRGCNKTVTLADRAAGRPTP